MLVLSRQRDETIMIVDEIEITIVDIRGDKVRLGISAPTRIAVHRKEVYEAISDESFFGAFSTANYEVADISPYEAADYIFDICEGVPDDMIGQFDFIVDGGSLDNVFDPLSMLRNMAKMLKPGGRMFVCSDTDYCEARQAAGYKGKDAA